MSLYGIIRSFIGYIVYGDIGVFPCEDRFPFVTWHQLWLLECHPDILTSTPRSDLLKPSG
jgi:hypothetical protein